MIKGSQTLRVGPNSRIDGKVKFPSSYMLANKKVCAVSVQFFSNLDVNYIGADNKYRSPNFSLFLNLFDSKGCQFVYNQNVSLTSLINWGRVNTFAPRFIDASKSYLLFYCGDDTSFDFNLVFYFA